MCTDVSPPGNTWHQVGAGFSLKICTSQHMAPVHTTHGTALKNRWG